MKKIDAELRALSIMGTGIYTYAMTNSRIYSTISRNWTGRIPTAAVLQNWI